MKKNSFIKKSDQFFYCLEGQLTIQHNNQKSFLDAGESLFMQAEKTHKVQVRPLYDSSLFHVLMLKGSKQS